MVFQRATRFSLYLLYLGILLFVGGAVYGALSNFSGRMMVPLGGVANVAVTTGATGWLQPELAPDAIPFSAPETARLVFTEDHYIPAHLPFNIRLDEQDDIRIPPPREELITYPPESGKVTELEGPPCRLHDVDGLTVGPRERWVGLLHNPRGHPMAAARLRLPKRSDTALLDDGGWYGDPRGQVAIHFSWGKERAPITRRWGVREGKRMHWFRELSPGTGVTLANGCTYTLAQVGKKEGVPALGIIKEVDGEEEAVTVRANAGTPDAPVLFEAWDLYPVKLYLHSRNEGFAEARVLQGNETRTLNAHEGDILYSDNDIEVRLEQVLAHALPVDDRGDPMYARTVTFMDKMITLREGEVRSIGPFRVRYRLTPLPPDQRSVLSLVDNDGHVREQHVLGPEQVWTTGTWRFAQAEDAPVSDAFIVLEVSRHQGGPARELGMVLFLVGALGWGLARGRALSGR